MSVTQTSASMTLNNFRWQQHETPNSLYSICVSCRKDLKKEPNNTNPFCDNTNCIRYGLATTKGLPKEQGQHGKS